MRKNPWALIAVIQFFVIISMMSCSNNPLGVGDAGADPQSTPIKADTVMVNLSKTNMRGGTRADEEITLQEFVNQTEPDIADFLPGKTCDVKYYKNGVEKTGYVKFNTDGTFECDNKMGYIIHPLIGSDTIVPENYRFLKNNIEFKYHLTGEFGNSETYFAYIDFSDVKTTELKIPPVEGGVGIRSAAILTPQE